MQNKSRQLGRSQWAYLPPLKAQQRYLPVDSLGKKKKFALFIPKCAAIFPQLSRDEWPPRKLKLALALFLRLEMWFKARILSEDRVGDDDVFELGLGRGRGEEKGGLWTLQPCEEESLCGGRKLGVVRVGLSS